MVVCFPVEVLHHGYKVTGVHDNDPSLSILTMCDDRSFADVGIRVCLIQPFIYCCNLCSFNFDVGVSQTPSDRNNVRAIGGTFILLAASRVDPAILEEVYEVEFTCFSFRAAIDFLFTYDTGNRTNIQPRRDTQWLLPTLAFLA